MNVGEQNEEELDEKAGAANRGGERMDRKLIRQRRRLERIGVDNGDDEAINVQWRKSMSEIIVFLINLKKNIF